MVYFLLILICFGIVLVVGLVWYLPPSVTLPHTPVSEVTDERVSLHLDCVLDDPQVRAELKIGYIECYFKQQAVVAAFILNDQPNLLWNDKNCHAAELIVIARQVVSSRGFGCGKFIEGSSSGRGKMLLWRVIKDTKGDPRYLVGYKSLPTDCEMSLARLLGSLQFLISTSSQIGDHSCEATQKNQNVAQGIDVALSHLCHDIRTPLHTISSLASLMEDEADPVFRVKQSKLIRLHVTLASELLKGLIELGLSPDAVEGGTMARATTSERVVPIGDVVRELYDLFSVLANEKGVCFDLELDELSDRHAVAEGPFRRVLLNLLSNAFKYTSSGRIVIMTSQQEGDLLLSLEDSGVGMSSEQLEQLGKPFERFSGSTVDGIGVGMSVVKQLCATMGIQLEVRSTLGVGSYFSLRLPARALSACDSFQQKVRIDNPLVIVADDDEVLCRSLCRSLERLGCKTIAVHNARELQAIAWFERPDAVISDYCFSDGVESGDNLWRNIPNSIPIIALTGDVSVQTEERLRAWGAAMVLTKPVHASRLRNVIDSVLG
jgi:CheY-like chemotaxis protein